MTNTQKPALVMLSGGIDSVYVAYKALSEGRDLRLHHIHLRNAEGRWEAEARAVKRALAWYRKNGLTNFRYTESTIDFGTLNWLPKDYASYAYVIGHIMSDPKSRHMNSFLHPRHSDAFNTKHGKVTFDQARKSADDMLTTIPSIIARREIHMEQPVIGMTKAEIIDDCPADLLKLAWYCRRPVKAGNTHRTCGNCFTCSQVTASVYNRKVAPKG